MKLPFRQGIVRYQTDSSANPIFLQKSNGGANIDLYCSPDPTIITFAHGITDYLFEERKTVPQAWGPFTSGIDYWLYWDIDMLTGARTFGFTKLAPIYSPTAPQQPANDQHWFDTINTKTFIWSGKWIEAIRVFACSYVGGSIIVPYNTGTQVGINQTIYAGYLIFDVDEKPIKQWKRDQTGSFITTESKLITHSSKMSTIILEAAQIVAEAVENIPTWSLVSYVGQDRIGLASYLDQIHPVAGLVYEDLYAGECGSFYTSGYITNNNWNWTEPPSTSLFCGLTGQLTTVIPQIGSIQRVGMIISSDTIYIDIGDQIILDEA
jgi:hypothetical protein